MWILLRTSGTNHPERRYVAVPGGHHSYTAYLERAMRFHSEEAARAASCPGSERPEHIENLLSR